VDRASVRLEGIAPYLTKADSLGHLVAKFNSTAVKALVEPGQATLVFSGVLKDGNTFAVPDTITVKQ